MRTNALRTELSDALRIANETIGNLKITYYKKTKMKKISTNFMLSVDKERPGELFNHVTWSAFRTFVDKLMSLGPFWIKGNVGTIIDDPNDYI